MHLVLRLAGGGIRADPAAEMGIAAGGLIKQTIIRDTHDPTIWDASAATRFNVQVLNSGTFTSVTSKPAPSTPITAKTYAKHGYPYFSVWDEKPTKITGDFAGVQSVNEMDLEGKSSAEKEAAAAEVKDSTQNPVVALNQKGERVGFRSVRDMEKQVFWGWLSR